MKKFVVFSVIIILISSTSSISYGASSDIEQLHHEIESLKQEILSLKKEINQIKQQLKSRNVRPPQAPQIVSVSIDDDPVMGEDDAPVTIIEFSDYQCPFCGRFYRNTLPLIKDNYIKSGKVKFVYRDFPLPFHSYAEIAAEAANCAGEQNKYWAMHDKLFENQRALSKENIKSFARSLTLDMEAFNSCFDNNKYSSEIKRDMEDGRNAGVRGTPSFFIGKTEKGKKIIKGYRIVGARPYASFKQIIDKVLTEK